ncbi:MAG: hypothetical protein AAFZ65_07165, partial [Planctomycetota bacterium]
LATTVAVDQGRRGRRELEARQTLARGTRDGLDPRGVVGPVSRAARERLASLEFSAPTATLIDGDGRRQTPWTSDPAEIREYTFGRQVTEPYDLTRSILVGLREFAPDRVVLPGPGNTLGGVVGQVLVEEGWRGVRSKSDFQVAQSSDAPIVESMRR